MKLHYNHIAGKSLERLAGLSDGIFAVAMTLLVIELQVPTMEAMHTMEGSHDLASGLLKLLPGLITYFMSFLTLGIFWVGHQSQLSHFARSNLHLVWIHLMFLFAVSLVPLSTAILAGFFTSHIALAVYWFNILILGVTLLGSLLYGERSGLIKNEATAEVRSAHKRHLLIGQAFYALGALLCLFNMYVGASVLILAQVNNALAPWIRPEAPPQVDVQKVS